MFPKPALCYQEEIAELGEIVFQCFRRVRETIARGVRLHLIRVVPIVAMCDSGVLFKTQGTQHTNTANTEDTQSKHTHTHTDPQTHTEQTHTQTRTQRPTEQLHKAQASQSTGTDTHTHILRVLLKSGQGTGDFLLCVSHLGCRALLCTPTKSLLFFCFFKRLAS